VGEITASRQLIERDNPDMPFRMADYALRIYRKFPDRQLVQVVIYLRKTTSRKVYETRFAANNFAHEFRVVRLWEQETEPFLESTGLLPYAALTDTDDRHGFEVSGWVSPLDGSKLKSSFTSGFWREVEQVVF
jgi:predicted transposase YdaD